MSTAASFSDLHRAIAAAMQADRHRLRRQLRSLEQAAAAGRPFDRNLTRLADEIGKSVARRDARRAARPALQFDASLPVAARREEIAQAIAEHQVVIVCGETGSGKSTQLPKICLELGRGIDGLIGHTQPRRIAARSVATRIAEELGTSLGRTVGYKVRFTDATSPQTYIKLMTDGILLAETQHDRFLDAYDTLIVDEAHERSLNIDFLLGYVKRLLPKRRELKLIITSATIDAARFAEHFATAAGPAPVIEVSGRTYPVELRYRPLSPDPDDPEQEPDFDRGLMDAIDELARIDTGDILLFMPTEHHIHEAAKLLRARTLPLDSPGRQTEILPLYARLSTAEQNRIFQEHKHRRIVIATNVAESSLTVPGIRYVIDPGTARISRYAARSKMQRLPIEPVSQASANQRMGRCGRVAPGVCIRLYSEEDYLAREHYTQPEIQRSNLASVILQTKALKLGDIEDFPFLDPPRPDAVRDGYKTLFELGAIDADNRLTDLGRQLARLPVDPRIGRIVLAGQAENCLHEVLIIASALETQDPRERPLEKKGSADEAHARFAHEESDFFGYLKLWDFWQHLKQNLSRNQLRHACRQNFLSYNRLREWIDVHRQLLELVEEAGYKQQTRRDDYAAIHRALLAGLLSNVAMRGDGYEYTVAGGGKCVLWPGSGVFAGKPKWIVAAEQVETSRRFLRTVARINPEWIEPLAAHLVARSHSDPQWNRRSASVMCQERVALFGLTIVAGRRVPYGPVAPDHARELFIQHALVEADYPHAAPFLEHNRRLLAELETLQTKIRRRDLLLGEEARYDFYDRRLPLDICDGHAFESWRRNAERKEPKLLYLAPSDLLREETATADAAQFPDRLAVRAMELPLAYRFDPGSQSDGVTLTVPREALGQLDRQQLGWLVPGLLEEKVVALIKSLPKSLRRNFVPAADTARRVLENLSVGEGSLTAAVAEQLTRIAGERVPADAFQLDNLPPHLQMNVRVVDAQGQRVAEARDVAQLRQELDVAIEPALKEASDPRFHRQGLTTWDFEELPEYVVLQRRGLTIKAFPALLDRGQSVSLELVDSAERAKRDTAAGLRRLYCLACTRELKAQTAWLPDLDKLRLYAATLPDGGRLTDEIAALIIDRAFLADQPLPRTKQQFDAQFRRGRNRIVAAVQDVTAVIGPLLEAYHQAQVALEQTIAPRFQYAAADVRSQLEHLVPGGFLTSTPWPWLAHLPRYLRAIRQRLDKLTSDGLARDQKNSELITPRWQEFLAHAEHQQQHDLVDPELDQYRWMLEEYRVSLFAQKLGTSLTVSEKRLAEQRSKMQPTA